MDVHEREGRALSLDQMQETFHAQFCGFCQVFLVTLRQKTCPRTGDVVGRFAAKRGSLRSPRGRFIASLTICHLYNLHVRTFYSHMRRASISFTKSTRTGKDANNYPSRWKESKWRLVLKFSSKMLNFSLLITLSCAIVGA